MSNRVTHFCCVIAISFLLIAQSGCRNRGPFLTNNFNRSFGPIAGRTTVAPPNTYSVQIPGRPSSQGSGVKQATNILPNGNPANSINVQNGWQPAGTVNTPNGANPPNNNTTFNSSTNPSQTPTSVVQPSNSTIQNRTQVVSVTPPSQPRNVQPVQNRVAQNPNSGLSFTDATNFRTTAVDERLDQTRLPVTDASQVRAPTTFSPTTTVGQFNTPYYVPRGQVAAQQRVAQPRIAAAQQVRQPTGDAFATLNQRPNPTTIVGTFGQPTFAQPAQRAYSGSNTQVLAQSTVYADPANDPNFANGWRNPNLTAGRDSFNR